MKEGVNVQPIVNWWLLIKKKIDRYNRIRVLQIWDLNIPDGLLYSFVSQDTATSNLLFPNNVP